MGAGSGESVKIRYDQSLTSRISEQCKSLAEGATGDLDAALDISWDQATFAWPGAAWADVEAEVGRELPRGSFGERVLEPTVIIMFEGEVVDAIEANHFALHLSGSTQVLQTVDAPGEFEKTATGCRLLP